MRLLGYSASVALVVCALLAPATATAQSLTPEQVATMEARLQLSPEQRSAIHPILEGSMSQRRAIFQKHGVDIATCSRPGPLGLIRLNRDIKKVNDDTRKRLAAILSAAQLSEYDRIVAEQTAIVKKQIMC
ncbi:MAG: hypothetical protein AAF405_03770 [Pseudomonadota bacterium]